MTAIASPSTESNTNAAVRAFFHFEAGVAPATPARAPGGPRLEATFAGMIQRPSTGS